MKLWFFGDSYTYGHGLPDCAIYNCESDSYDPGISPSKLGWANLVATELNKTHINLSIPGMSNLKIHWLLRHAELDPDDIVIVQWSFATRCAILDDLLEEVNVHSESELSRMFYKVHSPLDLERRSLFVVEHTELLMKQLGIKYIALANKPFKANLHAYCEISDYQDHYMIDRSLDGGHPGVESNRRWAAQVINLLRYKFGI